MCSQTNIAHIGGIPVEFPYKPYGSQLSYMSRVIATLDRAQRDGQFHALLESPTGTGKSLSLLCSVLAWQENQRAKKPPNPEPMVVDPEIEHPSGSTNNLMPTLSETNNMVQKKKIYYCSRTHAQIKQVIREFRKTNYHVPMAVLGSKTRYCTNADVRGQDNIDEKCKKLVKKRVPTEIHCQQFLNAQDVRAHPSVQRGGCYEVHDIEDLIKVGQMVGGCSYYGAQALAEVADIVFCPYNYIVNPQIRKAMEISVKGNIIILDEAHNIEDIARQASSIDVEEGPLFQLRKELKYLSESKEVTQSSTYQPLYEMIESIISWISRRKSSLGKHSFQHNASCWAGDKALKELEEAKITKQCFPRLQICATAAISIAREAPEVVPHLTGMSCAVLEDGRHICDFRLVLQCQNKSDAVALYLQFVVLESSSRVQEHHRYLSFSDFNIWDSFTNELVLSELRVHFGTSLEAPHVINVDSQLWAGVIHSGPNNYPLNASYKTSEADGFKDALGTSLEEIFKVVPGGCLVFFPSYKLMDRLSNRWSQTGQWSRLTAQKPIFVEPRGGQDELGHVLKDYYDTISQHEKPMLGRMKSKGNSNKGATLLAVCRGKVSEGIDFADEYARAVILIGIPFSNVFDIQVAEKKKYNDISKLSNKSLLSGNEWYCQQAFRALNQAAGRCIRHRWDYGAIIFLDERFRQEKKLPYISKWIRKSIIQYNNFNQSIEGLKSFFRDIKKTNASSTQQPIDVESIKVEEPRNVFTETTESKVTKASLKGQNSVSKAVVAPETETKTEKFASASSRYDHPSPKIESKTQKEIPADTGDKSTGIAYIDLTSDLDSSQNMCSSPPTIILSPDDFEISSGKETKEIGEVCPAKLEHVSDDEFSNSTIIQTKFPCSFSSSCSTSASNCQHEFTTPNKQHISNNKSPLVYSSVNSHANKRRKPSASVLVKMETFSSPDPKTPIDVMKAGVPESSCILDVPKTSSISCGDLKKKDVKICCSLCRNPLGLVENNYIVPCSTMELSKGHLALIKTGELDNPANGGPRSMQVVVSDIVSVDRKIWETSSGGSGQGIWSKEDGCVFNTILCTFCSNKENCLGLHVVATDSSNVQFLNKVLFYPDKLDIQHIDASFKKEPSPSSITSDSKIVPQRLLGKFAYVPPKTNSQGSQLTKSKMRLQKKSQSSNAKD